MTDYPNNTPTTDAEALAQLQAALRDDRMFALARDVYGLHRQMGKEVADALRETLLACLPSEIRTEVEQGEDKP